MKVCFCLRGSHMHIGTQFWSKELTNVHDGVFILVLGPQMVLVLEVKMFWSWMLSEVYFGLMDWNTHNVRLFWSKEFTNVYNGVCFNLESSNMHNANLFSSSNFMDMHNGSLFWFWKFTLCIIGVYFNLVLGGHKCIVKVCFNLRNVQMRIVGVCFGLWGFMNA
jgi:hypothetical protein